MRLLRNTSSCPCDGEGRRRGVRRRTSTRSAGCSVTSWTGTRAGRPEPGPGLGVLRRRRLAGRARRAAGRLRRHRAARCWWPRSTARGRLRGAAPARRGAVRDEADVRRRRRARARGRPGAGRGDRRGRPRPRATREMYLDTSLEQHEAIGLYRSLGFEEAEPYYDVPRGAAGLARVLQDGAVSSPSVAACRRTASLSAASTNGTRGPTRRAPARPGRRRGRAAPRGCRRRGSGPGWLAHDVGVDLAGPPRRSRR